MRVSEIKGEEVEFASRIALYLDEAQMLANGKEMKRHAEASKWFREAVLMPMAKCYQEQKAAAIAAPSLETPLDVPPVISEGLSGLSDIKITRAKKK